MNAGNSTLHFNELKYCTVTKNDSRGGGGRTIVGAIGLHLRRGCVTGPYSSRPFNNFVTTKRTFYRLKHCFNIAVLFVSTAS